MKNPFKPERSDQHHDNPAVPDAVERPIERAADRAAMHDNPVVPNVIERPVERAVGADRRAVVTDSHPNVGHEHGTTRVPVVERSIAHDRPTDDTRHIDLFPDEELRGYRTRWEAIQTGFVDQPRHAVEEADALVGHLMTRLTDVFTRERSTLEGQWTKGDDVSTEDLRIALTRYRSFFHRLLSM
jgi:hypothetical protein